jgi:hypothetical protein
VDSSDSIFRERSASLGWSQRSFAPWSFLLAVNAFNGSTMFVADGYGNTRLVQFDKTRPTYFNSVRGVAVDAQTRLVFVNDRNNHGCLTRTEIS